MGRFLEMSFCCLASPKSARPGQHRQIASDRPGTACRGQTGAMAEGSAPPIPRLEGAAMRASSIDAARHDDGARECGRAHGNPPRGGQDGSPQLFFQKAMLSEIVRIDAWAASFMPAYWASSRCTRVVCSVSLSHKARNAAMDSSICCTALAESRCR